MVGNADLQLEMLILFSIGNADGCIACSSLAFPTTYLLTLLLIFISYYTSALPTIFIGLLHLLSVPPPPLQINKLCGWGGGWGFSIFGWPGGSALFTTYPGVVLHYTTYVLVMLLCGKYYWCIYEVYNNNHYLADDH